MIAQYLQALFFIFVAEMGDKTQILAMMFATKYKMRQVLIGIFIGSFLNHGLAVAFGSLLGQFIEIYVLQMIAGIAFILFALWTLLGNEEEAEETLKSDKNKNAVIVVAMAFFIGELGDKTQLTAITLSVSSIYPMIVLLGTVSGMLVTSGLGIFVGSKIGDRLPEVVIKLVSSGIFLIFGILKLSSATPDNFINIYSVGIFIAVVMAIVILLVKTTVRAHKSGRLTPYIRASRALYNYANDIEEIVDDICKGATHCGGCKGGGCAIGFIRGLARELKSESDVGMDETKVRNIIYHKDKFDRHKLIHALEMNMKYLVTLDKASKGYDEIDLIRQIIEIMLFEETLTYNGDLHSYEEQLSVMQQKEEI